MESVWSGISSSLLVNTRIDQPPTSCPGPPAPCPSPSCSSVEAPLEDGELEGEEQQHGEEVVYVIEVIDLLDSSDDEA